MGKVDFYVVCVLPSAWREKKKQTFVSQNLLHTMYLFATHPHKAIYTGMPHSD